MEVAKGVKVRGHGKGSFGDIATSPWRADLVVEGMDCVSEEE